MVKLVNLSNLDQSKLRSDNKKDSGAKAYYLKEYRGLDVVTRAKKAAMYASNDGRCWWVHDWVFRELTWRDPNATSRT